MWVGTKAFLPTKPHSRKKTCQTRTLKTYLMDKVKDAILYDSDFMDWLCVYAADVLHRQRVMVIGKTP